MTLRRVAATLSVAASTLLTAARFQPLRRRVQTAVDHRLDRARTDAVRTAAAVAGRLHDQIDLAGLTTGIAETVGVALRPGGVGARVRQGQRGDG